MKRRLSCGYRPPDGTVNLATRHVTSLYSTFFVALPHCSSSSQPVVGRRRRRRRRIPRRIPAKESPQKNPAITEESLRGKSRDEKGRAARSAVVVLADQRPTNGAAHFPCVVSHLIGFARFGVFFFTFFSLIESDEYRLFTSEL